MNQTPEEIARDKIDKALRESGWVIQKKMRSTFMPGRVWR
jgi:type I site-specific restriction endonuclease